MDHPKTHTNCAWILRRTDVPYPTGGRLMIQDCGPLEMEQTPCTTTSPETTDTLKSQALEGWSSQGTTRIPFWSRPSSPPLLWGQWGLCHREGPHGSLPTHLEGGLPSLRPLCLGSRYIPQQNVKQQGIPDHSQHLGFLREVHAFKIILIRWHEKRRCDFSVESIDSSVATLLFQPVCGDFCGVTPTLTTRPPGELLELTSLSVRIRSIHSNCKLWRDSGIDPRLLCLWRNPSRVYSSDCDKMAALLMILHIYDEQ